MLWNPIQVYIGPVEGSHADNVHLVDPDAVMLGGQGDDFGPYWTITDEGIEARLIVTGASAADAQANAAAIADMLTRANRGSGVYGSGEPIILSMELADESWRYIDVLGGSIRTDWPDISGEDALVTLTLRTRPYARGTRYTATLTPESITNTTGEFLIEDIPGDAPALARVTAEDTSTGSQIITALRIGARSGHGLEAGDVTAIVDLDAAGGTEVVDADAVGGATVEIVPGSTWGTVASATIPGSVYQRGLWDMYLLMADDTLNIGAPTIWHIQNTMHRWTFFTTGTSATATGLNVSPSNRELYAPTGALVTSYLILDTGSETPSTPLGWTLRASAVNGTNIKTYVYERVLDGTESSPAISITLSGSTDWSLRTFIWIGLAASPFDKSSTNTGTSTSATTGATATLAQSAELVLAFHAREAASGITPTTGTEPAAGEGSQHSVNYRLTSATTAVNLAATLATSDEWASIALTYKAELNGDATSRVANLAAGTYQVRVAGLSATGAVGVPSEIATITLTASQPLVLNWAAPMSGTATTYRIYWNRGSGWNYKDTLDNRTQGVILSETGSTAGTPPSSAVTPAHVVRALVSLPSGVSTYAAPPTTGSIINGSRELVYLGSVPLPPTASLDGGTAEDTLIQIQTKWQSVSSTAIRFDALIMWPHDEPQMYGYIYGGSLADNRDWLLDSRRDGTVTARLYESGTTDDAGQPATNNVPLMLGPGAAHVIVHMTGTNGVADLSDLAADVTVELTPRWRLLGGST